jgi:purine-binding chemotaxis protein CheW
MPQELQFVTYRIGAQHFAIEIHRLTEVLSYGPITPLPGAPRFVEGMIDLRGELVPIIDLRKRMGLKDIRNQMQTRILITRIQQQKIGLIVDLADQVYTVPVENIKAPPEGSEFILAVAKQDQELLVILDLERLLTEQERVRLQSFQVK